MLELKNIKKCYKTGEFTQVALNNLNLKFRNNEFVAILGPSGSGKTTLLNIIGGLDRYTSGDLIINNKSTKKFKDKDFDAYRNNSIGFIFQSYNLIGHISILANVEMGMTLSGVSKKERTKRAKIALERVGLKKHIHKKPNELSGGQMQRVAIARALVNNPDIVLADEPTGALDSKTSKEVMELIKEIAKDKLVIMVTHNPALAEDYASRIITLKDGNIEGDTNPYNAKEENENYKLKKTSMSFLTALNLSFTNILTKKGRTILTAFASSIGILGIALVLSLSNGFKIQIDKFEKDTLSQAPLIISKSSGTDAQVIDIDKDDSPEFPTEKEIKSLKNQATETHENKLTKEYIDYLNKIDQNLIGGISYQRNTHFNVLTKNNDKIVNIDSDNIFFSIPSQINNDLSPVILDNFEAIEGELTSNKEDLFILVDSKNRVDEETLKALGFKDRDKINFSDLVGKEFKIVLNDNFYKSNGSNYVPVTDYEKLYENENNVTLKIKGIIRGKEGSDFAKLSGTGLVYNKSLEDYVTEKNEKSNIVKDQLNKDYNVITFEKFDLTSEEGKLLKENTLAYLGHSEVPMAIYLYPKDFDSKETLTKYLDDYNEGKEENDKISYTDQSELITRMSGSILDAITIVLVAFSGISLIVSTIMIGIITYISVLERTKEIGILRAIGARKKDITRVFNAETFMIGLSSGIIGIIGAILLKYPINHVIENLSGLKDVAKLNIVHTVILIALSIILTTIGGFIPAKKASKKDPVVALRTE